METGSQHLLNEPRHKKEKLKENIFFKWTRWSTAPCLMSSLSLSFVFQILSHPRLSIYSLITREKKNSNKHYKSKIISILNYKDAQTNLLILIPFKIVILIQMDGKSLNIHHCSKFHIPPTPAMKELHKWSIFSFLKECGVHFL